MLKICVAGAMGRMGTTILKEASNRDFQIVGAVEAPDNVNIGKSLRQLGICNSDIRLAGSNRIGEGANNTDIYITFTSPKAEVQNLPTVVNLGRRIILGTTGFNKEERTKVRNTVSGKVPAVFSPNFSVGVNILFKIAQTLKYFPSEYSFSISEIHHTGKEDAPSGTAKKLGEIISQLRGYSKTIYGREGSSKRKSEELEVSSLRLGGVPGIHNLIVAGPHEILKIEHSAFSRRVFAQGALYAAKWISKQEQPEIFSMENVLGFS